MSPTQPVCLPAGFDSGLDKTEAKLDTMRGRNVLLFTLPSEQVS